MATTPPNPGPAAPPPPDDRDWPAQATHLIVDQVGKIRDKTTGPAVKVVNYVLFGAFAISLGTVALFIFVIGAVRALNNYLPDAVFGETHVWAAHSILGAILLLIGVVVRATKAKPRQD